MDTFDTLRNTVVGLLADVRAIQETQEVTNGLLNELRETQLSIYTKLNVVEPVVAIAEEPPTTFEGEPALVDEKSISGGEHTFTYSDTSNYPYWNIELSAYKVGGFDIWHQKDPISTTDKVLGDLPNVQSIYVRLWYSADAVHWNTIDYVYNNLDYVIPTVKPNEAFTASPTFSFLRETEKKGFKLFDANGWWRNSAFEIPEFDLENTVTVTTKEAFWVERQNSKTHKIQVKGLDCVEDLAIIGHDTIQHIEFETLSHFRCGGRAMVTADKFVRPKSELNNVQPNVFAFGSHVLVDAPQISVSWAVLLWMNLPNQILQNIYLQSDMINGVWPDSTEALIAGAPCWINDFHPAEYKKHGPYDLYSFDCGILCGRYANAGADILQSVAQWYHASNPHLDIAHSMVINNMFGMITRENTGEQTLGDFKTRAYKLPVTVQDSVGTGSVRHQKGNVSTWGDTSGSHLGANNILHQRCVLNSAYGITHGSGDINRIEENLFARTDPTDNSPDINLYSSNTKLAPGQVKAQAQTKDNVFVNKRLIIGDHVLTEDNNVTIDPSQLVHKTFDIDTTVLKEKVTIPIGVIKDVDGYAGIWSSGS